MDDLLFDRPFSADHRVLITFKAVWLTKKVNEGAVYLRWHWKDSHWTVLWASHSCIKRRWKSPKLNSQLSFKKLTGIIRGFSGKCDNGNLDWIVVEISAPFGRQMSRKTSGDPIEVERLSLVFCWNNEYVPHRGYLLKITRIPEFGRVTVLAAFMFSSIYILYSDWHDDVW